MRQTLIVLLMCATASGCAKDEEAASPPASAPQASAAVASREALEPVALDVGKAQPAVIEADIDCDGIEDTARMEYVEDRVRVTVTLAATKTSQSLEFGLGDSMAQESLCGTEATLEIEDMDYDLIEIFGENPEGFRESKTCKGLRLMGGECDSMHIFWNHDTQHIDWWRL
jgi:hypothetical protein